MNHLDDTAPMFARVPADFATGRGHLRLVHSDTTAAPVDGEEVR